jgi:hypothetical protein
LSISNTQQTDYHQLNNNTKAQKFSKKKILRNFKFLLNPITGKIKLPETDPPTEALKTHINN